MSASDNPANRSAAGEPRRDEIEAARALLAGIESRVFPGSQTVPLYAQSTAIRQAVMKLFGHGR
jgi:hypothetical protein